jgi:hypothetical protein
MIASVIMGLVARMIYGISGAGDKGSPVYLFLSIVAAVPVYVICLWLVGEVKESEKSLVMQLWFKVTGKGALAKFGREY